MLLAASDMACPCDLRIAFTAFMVSLAVSMLFDDFINVSTLASEKLNAKPVMARFCSSSLRVCSSVVFSLIDSRWMSRIFKLGPASTRPLSLCSSLSKFIFTSRVCFIADRTQALRRSFWAVCSLFRASILWMENILPVGGSAPYDPPLWSSSPHLLIYVVIYGGNSPMGAGGP